MIHWKRKPVKLWIISSIDRFVMCLNYFLISSVSQTFDSMEKALEKWCACRNFGQKIEAVGRNLVMSRVNIFYWSASLTLAFLCSTIISLKFIWPYKGYSFKITRAPFSFVSHNTISGKYTHAVFPGYRQTRATRSLFSYQSFYAYTYIFVFFSPSWTLFTVERTATMRTRVSTFNIPTGNTSYVYTRLRIYKGTFAPRLLSLSVYPVCWYHSRT